MPAPRPPRGPDGPKRPAGLKRPGSPKPAGARRAAAKPDAPKRAKSPAAAARDARRAAQHIAAGGGGERRVETPRSTRMDDGPGGDRRTAKPRPDKPRPDRAARARAIERPGDAPRPRRGAGRVEPRPAAAAPATPVNPGEGERLAKLLARAGVASRREIERMVTEGRIALGGVAIDTPATILKSLAGVTVDGRPVQAAEPTRLFRFHKPAGFLTTERDPKGRPTIYDRLPAGLPRLMPVGRLDLSTEGLLLMTTDGGLKRQLELPATGVARTYRARVFGPISQTQLEALIDGIEIDGIRYGSIDANMERRTGRNGWVEMTLREGKNREVRRVLEYLGVQVSRLIRVRYGPFVLGELAPGAVEEVPGNQLHAFAKGLR